MGRIKRIVKRPAQVASQELPATGELLSHFRYTAGHHRVPQREKTMTMRELDIQFQNAMNELQASFEKQHREWQQSYQALQQQLEAAQQREMALRMQNEQLMRKLSTASSVPEQHALIKQIKMLGAHLDALAKDAATFNRYAHNQQHASGNFSGEQHG